jgi:hypothetical protein
MNIDLNELIKSKSGLLVVLGSLFILLAAFGGLPGQNALKLETAWRYIIVGIGTILLVIGVIFVIKDTPATNSTKKLSKDPVKTFETDKEYADYKSKRLNEARKRVCDLTYEDFTRNTGHAITFFTPDDRKEYIRTIERISEDVTYQEIIMFMGKESRITKAKELIQKAGKCYQLAGYPDVPLSSPPRHNFIIIDDEVFIKGLVISNTDIVEYYRRFYDELWSSAIPIKVSTVENFELLKVAEEKLKAA